VAPVGALRPDVEEASQIQNSLTPALRAGFARLDLDDAVIR
jgi:hypothetical protein